ncbi:MAG TPA: lipid-binding SYLF domain-containing protein [Pyrinomonadaceae bacterium]|jgi:lipid-binding SYLF domain-containing protein|nr:lipid-binding SYLF domain-containing protein [Pyrinomonadaceae bacterium]
MLKFRSVFAVSILLILASGSYAQNKEIRDAAKTADKATKALNEVMAIPADAIPEALIKRAHAVAVFPDVIKAAFLVGGSGGKGLITRRLGNSWSAPAMFNMGGGSFGAQIGASSTDYVMLFMTEDSLQSLLQDKFEIGGEASVAAGPVGRTAKASTDAQLKAAILSYSRSKGLFAGVSLSGAVISPDNDANRALYSLTAKEILTGANKVPIASIPAATKGFQEAVTRHGL